MNSARFYIASLLLIVIVFTIYFPVLSYPLVHYDDLAYVGENSWVLQGLSWEGVRWAFTTNEQANWHPITWLSHMLDCELLGLEQPGRYHAVNLVLHILNSLLTLLLFVRMTGTYWRSLLIAVLFAVHPLHVESVAWVSERKDVLSTFFWLGSMLSYVTYVQHRKWSCYGISCLLLSAGLMSKPMLVTAPFVLLLLDYWPLHRYSLGGAVNANEDKATGHEPTTLSHDRTVDEKKRSTRGRKQKRKKNRAVTSVARSVVKSDANQSQAGLGRLILEKLPMFLLVILSSSATYFVQKGGGAVGSVPLDHRFATIVMAYVRYFSKTCWPTNLAVLYPNYPGMWSVFQTVGAVVLLLTLTIIVCIWRRQRYLTVGWLWFVGTLVPVIGVVQIGEHSMADRYMYVPIIGLLIFTAWGLAEIAYRSQALRTAAFMVAVISCVASSIVARQQVLVWQNSESLFRRAVEVTENNYSMHDKLGDELRRQDRVHEATEHYRHAIRIKPDFSEAYSDLGVMLQEQGLLDEAIEQYATAIRFDPDLVEAYTNMGVVLDDQGKTDKALTYFNQALAKNPFHAETLYNVAAVYYRTGELREAVIYYRKAIDAKSDYAEAYNNLGVILHKQKQMEEAIDCLREAIRIRQDYAEAYYNLGNVLVSAGRKEEAITQYSRSLELNPSDFRASFNLLRQLDRWDEALEVLKQAVRSRPAETNLRDMLRVFKREIRRRDAGR